MRHDWIFDVLTDLRDYALRNDLPRLAAQVEVSLATARDEVARPDEPGADPLSDAGTGLPQKPDPARKH